jgi:hypothetical protein
MTPDSSIAASPHLPRESIEENVVAVGGELLSAIGDVVGAVARPGTGPVAAARLLEVDKVLMSRVLKALRAGDTVEGLSAMPGTGAASPAGRAGGREEDASRGDGRAGAGGDRSV